VRGVVRAAELERYVGRNVRLLGWCVATKRVDLRRRKETRDLLALQAADHDWEPPNGDGAARVGTAEDLGLVRPAANSPYEWGRAMQGRKAMKFMSMEDLSGTFEVVLFPQAYERLAHLTVYAGPFVVSGTVEEQFDTYTVNATGLRLLTLAGDQQR